VKRKWEVFPGKNTFFCNGRLVMGRQVSLHFQTLAGMKNCTLACSLKKRGVKYSMLEKEGKYDVFQQNI